MGQKKKVVVLGGGLAGMTAALKLCEQDFEVELYEIKDRLGGKVGSDWSDNGDLEEHSYKVFPMFYENLWKVFDDIGITQNFYDCHQYTTIALDKKTKAVLRSTLKNPIALNGAFGNLRCGLVPFGHMILFYYMNVNLMSQTLKRRDFFDRVSINGLHRSWKFKSTSAANAFEEIVLKALATPNYRVSSMTINNVLNYWFKEPFPMVKLSNDNLHITVVKPFEKALLEKGCKIFKQHQLVTIEIGMSNTVEQLEFRNLNPISDEDSLITLKNLDYVISALPARNLVACLSTSTLIKNKILSNLNYLEYRTMPVLHIYFNKKMVDVPDHPISLKESVHQLSLVDISQTWKAQNSSSQNTILNVVVADITNLSMLSDEEIKQVLMLEVRKYIPFNNSDIEKTYFNRHTDEPVFSNDSGIWKYRPTINSGVDNLFLAGAYLKTQVDMVSMEGAVTTGLQAARAVDLKENDKSSIKVKVLKKRNRFVIRILKYTSMIFAGLTWVALAITGKLD